MRTLFPLALLGAAAACTEPAEPAGPLDVQKLPATVALAVGQSIGVSGAVIGFGGVNSDSRCARDLVCVWAGNAEIRVTIGPAVGDGPVHLVALNTTLEPHRSDETYGLLVTLVDLLPARVSTQPTRNYRAVIRIERAP